MDVLTKPSLPSGLLRLLGLDQTWPAAQVAGVLKNNGAGTLSWATLALADLPSVPRCRAKRTTDLSTTSGVVSVVSLDAEDFDTDGMHDNSTNPSRITFTTAGTYLLLATLYYEG